MQMQPSAQASLQSALPKAALWRVLLGLFVPIIGMIVVFGAFGTYFAVRHGLRGEEIGQAMLGLAAWPVLINLGLILLATVVLSRQDGLSLRELGWGLQGRSVPIELAIGLGLGLAMAATNQLVLYPLLRAAPQMGPAPFDPTLPSLGLVELLVIQGVGALAEDTLYRGYGLAQLRRRLSAPAAVAITSVAHALFAFGAGPLVMLWHVGFAAGLAGLFLWRRNLVVVIVVHLVVALIPRLLTYV